MLLSDAFFFDDSQCRFKSRGRFLPGQNQNEILFQQGCAVLSPGCRGKWIALWFTPGGVDNHNACADQQQREKPCQREGLVSFS